MAKKASLATVARKAGVSLTTVSMVLNGKSQQIHISEATRRRVVETARKVGYQPRVPEMFSARVRKLLRHVSLAFVDPGGRETHEFFGPALYEIVRSAGRDGLLVHGSDGVRPSRAGAYCRERRRQDSDGLILFTFENQWSPWMDDVKTSGLPCVVYNRAFEGLHGVVMDHAYHAARQATRVLKAGHRRVACVVNEGIGSTQVRFGGFRTTLDKARCFAPELVVRVPYDLDATAAAVGSLFKRHPEITALLCTTDLGALGAMRAASRLGLRVPRDCSIASLDGYEFSRYADPPLDTVQYPRVEMAREALRLLRRVFLNPAQACTHKVVRGKPLPGGTIGPAPRS